jgi:hypothetical protein
MSERSIAAVLLLSLAACGGGGAAPAAANQVNGTVAGQAIAAKDAIARPLTVKGDAFSGTSLSIDVTDWADACGKERRDAGTALGRALWMNLVATDASGTASAASAPGTYRVVATGTPPRGALLADVFYEGNDAACFPTTEFRASSGAVQITAVSASRVVGTFDVVLENGDHVTGTFDAASCDAFDPNRTPLATCGG